MTNQPLQDTYMIRKKVFKLFGEAFHIYDSAGNVVFYSKLKAFKLREDIRLYTGEDMRTEVLTIKARNIIDFSAAYDVVDTVTGEKAGALKRKGLKSLVQDEWVILDPNDREIGFIREDSLLLALLRRFATGLIPQGFTVDVGGKTVAVFKRLFNPFVLKMTIDFSPDPARLLDRRLGLAGAILLSAIEGRQD